MTAWRQNLYISMLALFIGMGAINLVLPFLGLYVRELGVRDAGTVKIISGFAISATFFSAMVCAPIWSRISEKYGKKMMLMRAGFGLGVLFCITGMVRTPEQLIFVRLVNGVFAGIAPAAVALVAVNTPKEYSGRAIGMVHSSAVAGAIVGPLIGGILADMVGFRASFFYAGMLCLASAFLVLIGVKESSVNPQEGKVEIKKIDLKALFSRPIMLILFTLFLVNFVLLGVNTLLPFWVEHVATGGLSGVFWSGIVIGSAGIANMIAAPIFGRIMDAGYKIEALLLFTLSGLALAVILHWTANSLLSLLAVRLLFGLSLGGINTSLLLLLRRHSIPAYFNRMLGYYETTFFMGNLVGPILLGFLSAGMGIGSVFIVGGTAILLWASWLLIQVNCLGENKSLSY